MALTLHSTHCLHTSMNHRKNEVLFLYLHLFKNHSTHYFALSGKVCKLRGETMLLTDTFSYYVQQPSSWRNVNQKFRQPMNMFVYPWHRLTIMSHDQLTFSDVWTSCSEKGSSKENQRQVNIKIWTWFVVSSKRLKKQRIEPPTHGLWSEQINRTGPLRHSCFTNRVAS